MRRPLIAVAALAGACALAGTSAAGTSVTTPFSGEAINNCNGELVTVEGNIHTTASTTTDTNGTHFHVTVNLSDVKGVALVSGARYVEVLTQTQTANFSFDGASEQNGETTQILNRLGEDGTPDDFYTHVSFHMTVNANGVPTVDRTDSRIDCR